MALPKPGLAFRLPGAAGRTMMASVPGSASRSTGAMPMRCARACCSTGSLSVMMETKIRIPIRVPIP